jgi:hypothetical protein
VVDNEARWRGLADPWVDSRIGNNVGELDHPFLHDLSGLCLFSQHEHDGPLSEDRCFTNSGAWSDERFCGGHDHSDCELFDRLWEPCTIFTTDPCCSPGIKGRWLTDDKYLDLDRDGVPNEADKCYLDDTDTVGDWPRAGDRTLYDLDGDGVVNECDACPLAPSAWKWVDSDGDGIPDGCDLCVLWPDDPDHPMDYYGAVVDGLPSPYDQDGDGIGDRCDPCPRHDWNRGAWPLEPGWAADFWRAHESVDPAEIVDGVRARWDDDGDGVGDACDNCRDVFNPDQANCNEVDELVRWRGGSPPGSIYDFRGTGDACDATLRLTTEMHGCACTDQEQDLGDCERDEDKCPQLGVSGPRWKQGTYPDQEWVFVYDGFERLHPTYDFLRLYWYFHKLGDTSAIKEGPHQRRPPLHSAQSLDRLSTESSLVPCIVRLQFMVLQMPPDFLVRVEVG